VNCSAVKGWYRISQELAVAGYVGINYGGRKSWSQHCTNVCLVLGFFLKGMVFLAGRGWGQRTPMDSMSTGSGAGGGSSMKVWSGSTMLVALWIVVGGEWESQGDSPSAAVFGSGVGAGGTTPEAQGICVLWVCASGCGLLVISLSGYKQGAFLSWLSSWENFELTFSSSPMT